jgi:hypothetical protein
MPAHNCNKLVELTELKQQQRQFNEEIIDIKESLKWSNRYLIGILVTVIMTLIGGFFK